jgi:hypothetical protein
MATIIFRFGPNAAYLNSWHRNSPWYPQTTPGWSTTNSTNAINGSVIARQASHPSTFPTVRRVGSANPRKRISESHNRVEGRLDHHIARIAATKFHRTRGLYQLAHPVREKERRAQTGGNRGERKTMTKI